MSSGSVVCAAATCPSHRPRPSPSRPPRRPTPWASSTRTAGSCRPSPIRQCCSARAEITGDVVVGDRTIIGAGVKIIGDSHGPVRIGDDVQILENTVLHLLPDNELVIDDGAIIGPGAMIHGCHIGAGSVIEPGAIVCDGSVVGAGCVVRAGAVVKQRARFPDGTDIDGFPAVEIGRLAGRHRRRRGRCDVTTCPSAADGCRRSSRRFRSRMGADQGHASPVGPDRRQDPARAHADAQPLVERHALPLGAGPDHATHAGRRPQPRDRARPRRPPTRRPAPPNRRPASSCTTVSRSPTSTSGSTDTLDAARRARRHPGRAVRRADDHPVPRRPRPRQLRHRCRRPIPPRPAVERRRARGVRRLVLRQGQPGAPVLARLRPRHQPVLRQAGAERRRASTRSRPRRTPTRSSASASGPATRTPRSPPTTPTPPPNPPSSRAAAAPRERRVGSRRRTARSRSSATTTSGAPPTPRRRCSTFLQSAYEAGASLAGWDLADTATRWCPIPPDRLTQLSVATHSGHDTS